MASSAVTAPRCVHEMRNITFPLTYISTSTEYKFFSYQGHLFQFIGYVEPDYFPKLTVGGAQPEIQLHADRTYTYILASHKVDECQFRTDCQSSDESELVLVHHKPEYKHQENRRSLYTHPSSK